MFCENVATMHQTVIVNKHKRETHLCEKCARERGLISTGPGPQIDLKAILNLMIAPHQSRPTDAACRNCGMTYAAFKASGRFGCAGDYDVFGEALAALFEKVHRGTEHRGKIPATVRAADPEAAIAAYTDQMNAAAEAEDYEEATRLRDMIRGMEAEGTSG
jgi:protein arginine kinase activator